MSERYVNNTDNKNGLHWQHEPVEEPQAPLLQSHCNMMRVYIVNKMCICIMLEHCRNMCESRFLSYELANSSSAE
jgi:hypothetical protein